ncbi:MAG TPA: MarC family protein [Bdellovibrionota bacterium]|nr:MarC family protein [Bdellovibrionota bacterium]
MIQNFALTFVAVFVALDIIGTLPLYIGMTTGLSRTERDRVVNTSMLVALLVALVFVFLGDAIFRFIGIAVFDFKIAGGLILLLVSLADLIGQQEATKRASGSTGIVPLAVPLITGPGVLTTLILQVNNAGIWITVLALLLNYVFAWALLRKSDSVARLIGKDGTVVVSKISALLLAAIAVAMIRGGLSEAIRAF